MNAPILLIGYRATGKTSVARILSALSSWSWLDADDIIEERAGCTIAEIFAKQGETAFRDLEAEILAELVERPNLIVATGGGAPVRESNRDLIRKAAAVVYLTATPETIFRRMYGDATTAERRPSLTDKDPMEEICSLLQVRKPIYESLATLTLATDELTPEQLAEKIWAELA